MTNHANQVHCAVNRQGELLRPSEKSAGRFAFGVAPMEALAFAAPFIIMLLILFWRAGTER